MTKWSIISVLILAIGAGFLGYQLFLQPGVRLPWGETKRETVMVQDQIEQNLPSVVQEQREREVGVKREFERTREIFVTNGMKHSVPLGELISGGPPKDGIPSIDVPKFISVAAADRWLADTEPGLAFSRGRTHRFYPYQILVWHEIVNDTVEGERILVTYCPLCLTGFVFEPLAKGERVEFGTSGKLWKSNLVLYDRKTDTLWSQILGEAILGELTGAKLKLLESDQLRYGEWKRKFPLGQVLSRDTGAIRFYGQNPYGDYFAPLDFALNLAGGRDTRLPNDAFIFGIVINGKPKAYWVEAVKQRGEIEDEFQGLRILLGYDRELDMVRVFRKAADGRLERINPFSAFWFSWVSAHPDTEVYQ